ncbi:MAG: ABC transporter substrate-binding protein [Anaerolineae bacterium]
MRKWITCLALLVMLVAVAACGGQPASAPSASQASDASKAASAPAQGSSQATTPTQAPAAQAAAKPGGTNCPVVGGFAVTGTNAEAANINPLLRVDTDGDYLTDWVFDRVLDVDPKTFEPIPWLAESWDISKDGLVYTFKLRKDVKWHDGQPFTAKDVAFTLNTILSKDYTGPFRSRFNMIAGAQDAIDGKTKEVSGIKVLDDYTVQITLAKPTASFLVTSMRELKPVPQHLVQGQDIAKGEWAQKLIGTGPFKFKEWKKGDSWTFEANTDYWGGRPCLDGIRHQVIPDLNAMLVALESGDIDTSIVPPVTEIPRLKTEKKLNVIELPPSSIESVQFNLQNPYLKDVRVRQAIAMALDMKAFTNDILKGVTQPADSVVVPTLWTYDKSQAMPTYDVEKAKKLLADAGYPNGFTLKWSTNSGNLFREQFTTFAQAQLAKIGIKLEPVMNEWPVFLKSVQDGQFEIATQATASGLPDPDSLYQVYKTGAPSNYYKYSNAQVDKLLDDGRAATTVEDRKKAYQQVQKILADELPNFYAYYRPNPIVTNLKLKGITPNPIQPYYHIQNWYKEK